MRWRQKLDRFDWLAMLGVLAVTSGIGLIDYRFGLIVLGLGMIGWAVIGARAQAPAKSERNAAGGKVEIRD